MTDIDRRSLPTALVVGPMKCGTTWIHEYLEARGDVRLPHLVKETFYFDRFRGRGLGWYSKRFGDARPGRYDAVVEVAPSLFHHSDTLPAIIREELGDIPILVTLRDPVDRAWSHYQHLRRGYTRQLLPEAIKRFPEIVSASRYSLHLPRWREAFSEVRVVHQELLAADPGAYAATVADALRLPPQSFAQAPLTRSNEATRPRSFYLAQLGRKASHGLRRAGLYSAVDIAKRAGLKPFFFGDPAPSPMPSQADVTLLQAELAKEL